MVQDNLDTHEDNDQTQDATATEGETPTLTTSETPNETLSWREQMGDIGKSPSIQKFKNDVDGLKSLGKSYQDLEKMLGHEKVPVPKGEDDVGAWEVYSKAFGIPDSPDKYEIDPLEIPDNLKGVTLDEQTFRKLAHELRLTPQQAKNAYKRYGEITLSALSDYQRQHQQTINNVRNSIMQEWGDAYDSNVDLGQTVINKFSRDKEDNDYLTATLSKDPRGVRFLASIGKQFAENKIGEFTHKSYAMSPQQAQEEIDKIVTDQNHPYMNDKAPHAERQKAIDYVNSLYATIYRAKG
jgi:hypothetical protein